MINNILRIALIQILSITNKLSPEIIYPEHITFDIRSLIDNHDGIMKIIHENELVLDFDQLILICDWLYEHYKKNNHSILSNRILNTFTKCLSLANFKRKTDD